MRRPIKFAAVVLILVAFVGCAAAGGVGKVATGLAAVDQAMRDARDCIDKARAGVGPIPAAHLADADQHLAEGQREVAGAVKAEAEQQRQFGLLRTDYDRVRNSLGYRVERFIINSFWIVVISTITIYVGSIALYVFCGGAAGPIGIVARELHAILPLMAPANWIAAAINKPAAVPVAGVGVAGVSGVTFVQASN